MGFLIDTCAVSEAVKKRPDKGLTAWMRAVDPLSVYVSVVTLGEIRKGIECCSDSSRKAALEAWLTTEVLEFFAGRILAFDSGVADRWGRLIGSVERHGRIASAIDSLIAATALQHNLSVVTRNERHFDSMGVGITNPWNDRE